MGYRIEYGSEPERFVKKGLNGTLIWTLSGVFLLLFGFLTVTFWPDGREMLQDVLLPGDPEVTRQAFAQMTDRLRAGEAIGDAVITFCREVVDGAALSN